MSIDMEAMRLEALMWQCQPNIRWHRPKGADDNDIYLEQLWERVTGEREWRRVETLLED